MTVSRQGRFNIHVIQTGDKRHQWALYEGQDAPFLRSRREFGNTHIAISDARAFLQRFGKEPGAVTYGVGEFTILTPPPSVKT